MEINSAFSSGLQGYQRASDAVSQASANINQASAETRNSQQSGSPAPATGTPTVEQSLVDLTVQQGLAEANLKSVQTADEMLGSVIDLRV